MWLTAANVGFTAAGALLYWIARRHLLRREAARSRNLELAACGLVALLAVGGFGLAHVGMNASWTGRAAVTDLTWLRYALAFAAVLLGAHVLLRLQRSRADQLMLPAASFLVLLGLVNIHVWETRDANAYVSTSALPALREYRAAIAEDRSLAPGRRDEILRALGAVPNELDYERRSGRFATVLNADWLARYNAAVRRFEAGRAANPGRLPALRAREVSLGGSLHRQLLAASLGFLLVPLVLLATSRVPAGRLTATRAPLLVAAFVLLGIAGSGVLTAGSRRLPPLLEIGGYTFIVYELLKVGLVVLLALALARPTTGAATRARSSLWLAYATAALTIAAMLWRDPGAGVALLAVALLMATLGAGRLGQAAVICGAVAAVAAAPAAVRAVGVHLPQTVRVRMEMWTDPWGAYQRAEVQNDVTRALARVSDHRRREAPTERGRAVLASHGRSLPAASVERDAGEIARELRWRLAAVRSREGEAAPLIPGADPVEKLLLLEAETLWSELGGFRAARASGDGAIVFESRVEEAIRRLQTTAHRLAADRRQAQGALAPDNFQLQRSLYALRHGGALGVGLGLGRPEAVPGVIEDLDLAALGESLGLAGLLLVALFVLLLAGRGIELGRRQGNPLLALLAVGFSGLLGLQAVVRIGGVTGMVPFTGLTFPLVSRSGTGLVASFLILALLMAISARPGWAPPAVPSPHAGPARLLASGGLPAAFAVVLPGVALLQLTGRTLAPGPVLAGLPGPGAPFLHASDQWDGPSYRRVPGPIVDRHGRVLAETTSVMGNRVYPDRRLATSVGHTLLQLDLAFRDELLQGRPSRSVGPTLVTTIDSGVQRAVSTAFEQGALEGGLPDVGALRGAVVVLDVKDGGIVALESRPAFSLEELSDPVAWAEAEARERRSGFPYRYLHRAVHGFYPPGSIFKTVTAAAALERGFHTLRSRDFDYRHGPEGRRGPDGIRQLGPWHQLGLPDGPPITDGNHPHLDEWLFDLEDAYAWSCNVAFAQMGLEVGPADLVGFARRFGFEQPLRVPGLGTATGTLDNDWQEELDSRYLARSSASLARTAFGQGQARVTPLLMALVPAGIAGGGKIMQPHVVAGWKSGDGTWLRRYRPRVFSDTRLSRRTIAQLRRMMWASATYGWARGARVNPNNADPGVAGKTGSAEWSEQLDVSHAWFIGFFPAEAPRLALAVVIERGGPGPIVAARVARRIFSAEAVYRYVREENAR